MTIPCAPDLLTRLTDARTVAQHTEPRGRPVDLRLSQVELETLIVALEHRKER